MIEEQTNKDSIQYHPAFVRGLEILFWDYLDQIDIQEEQVLKTGGIRVDVIILKNRDVSIDFDIARIFRKYNIIEYKRANDSPNEDVFSKVMGYVYLYKSLSKTVGAVPFSELTASIYRHNYPKEFFKKIESDGGTIEKRYDGVYEISGFGPIKIQILVGKELDPKIYAMLRVLTPDVDENDVRIFSKMAVSNENAKYRECVDVIYQASVSANK